MTGEGWCYSGIETWFLKVALAKPGYGVVSVAPLSLVTWDSLPPPLA